MSRRRSVQLPKGRIRVPQQYRLRTDVTSYQNKNNMADSEEQSGMISQFVNISGVSEERARFYLESASWNLEVCVLWFL